MGVCLSREKPVAQENLRASRRDQRAGNQIGVGEIRETRGQSPGLKKPPIGEPERSGEPVLEAEPPLADERVRGSLRARKPGEDSEQSLVGQEESPVGIGGSERAGSGAGPRRSRSGESTSVGRVPGEPGPEDLF